MIIYVLIIVSALFFLAWNLIRDPKIHFIASLMTTLLFVVTVLFAIANFSYHYGMHQVTEPQKTHRIVSTSSQRSLQMVIYRPMGKNRSSQLVIYKNKHDKLIHTEPDLKVTNQIVQNNRVTKPRVVTTLSKWKYRDSIDRLWFGLAKRSSTYRIKHVFYIPESWHVLSDKQAIALKQIIKNRSKQLKETSNNPQAKLRSRQQSMMFVKAQEMKATQKNPKLSIRQKKLIAKKSISMFKNKVKLKAEHDLIKEALKTTKSIN